MSENKREEIGLYNNFNCSILGGVTSNIDAIKEILVHVFFKENRKEYQMNMLEEYYDKVTINTEYSKDIETIGKSLNRMEEIVKLRVFNDTGDLTVRKDSGSYFWNFIGEKICGEGSKTIEADKKENDKIKNFWAMDLGENNMLTSLEKVMLISGKGESQRTLNYRILLLGGQPQFTWYYALEGN